MKMLINLQVMEAKNVVCVWREDGDDEHQYFECGIALDTAKANYMIPRYIAIGTFSDGTTKAGGLHGLNDINNNDGNSDDCGGIFLYHQFLHSIGLYDAKAFVRGLIACGEYDKVNDAKAAIIYDMNEAGVELTEDADDYLNHYEAE
jgi:hypothetical protein